MEDAALADVQPVKTILAALRNNEDALIVHNLTEAGAKSLRRILPKFKVV